MKLSQFVQPRPKVLVVSHERSGTHFLMNSIAKCFGYVSSPWVNFDTLTLATNFHSSEAIAEFFSQFQGMKLANIVKSHHPFLFFEKVFEEIAREFHVFYIYRDPRDVMVSYWRYLNQLSWHEGPCTDSPKEFIRSTPEGNLLRYQRRQESSMVHRWRTHVESWTSGLPERFRAKVSLVRFRDLQINYEGVMRSMSPILGSPISFERPALHESSILPGKGISGGYKEHFNIDDLAFFREVAGPTMDRLGFQNELVTMAS